MKIARGKTKLILTFSVMLVLVAIGLIIFRAINGSWTINAADNGEISKITEPVEPDFVRDELIIKFKPGSNQSDSSKAISSTSKIGAISKIFQSSDGTKSINSQQGLDEYYLLKIDASKTSYDLSGSKNAAEETKTSTSKESQDKLDKIEKENARKTLLSLSQQLESNPAIESVNLNYIRKTSWIPNDKYFGLGYSFGNSYDAMWGLKNISISEAWDKTKGAGVVVAIVDSGVDVTHEDLAENIYKDDSGKIIGKNFASYNDWCESPHASDNVKDELGHGTHVAGTVAAVGNNQIGVVGVAPEAKIMPVRVMDCTGSGNDSEIAAGIQYAVDNHANVINMSLGGPGDAPLLEDAVKYAISKNVTVVVAAGNNDSDADAFTPANIPEVISAAALDPYRQKSDFSNFGPKIDVSAPGVNILSTIPPDSYIAKQYASKLIDGKYMMLDGTSMASPHVAGLVALMISEHQTDNLTPQKIKDMLHNSTDVPDAQDPVSDLYGFGYLNASKSVNISSTIDFPRVNLDNLNFLQKNNFAIKGSVANNPSGNYQVSYRVILNFPDPNAYPQYQTLLSGKVTSARQNFATFRIAGKNDGVYYLKTVSQNQSGYKSMAYERIQLAKGQPDGFPLESKYINETIDPISTKLDGIHQVTIATTYAGIDVYNTSNQKQWSYSPNGSSDGAATYVPTRPLVCDNNGDGKKEIIAIIPADQSVDGIGIFQKVVALDDTGKVLWTYLLSTEWADRILWSTRSGTFLCEDLNNDQKDEIIITERKQPAMMQLDSLDLVIIGSDGKPIKKVNLDKNQHAESENGYAAIGDINGDGKKELAVSYSLYDRTVWPGAEQSKIKVFDTSLDLIWEKAYPVFVASEIGTLEIGDFDNDSKSELLYVLSHRYKTGQIGSWGQPLLKTQTRFFFSTGSLPTRPKFSKTVFFDPPLIPTMNDGQISLYGTYTEPSGRVVSAKFSTNNGSMIGPRYVDTFAYSTANLSVDVNNDNKEELIVFNPAEGPRVIKDSKRVQKFYGGSKTNSGIISDMNGDGKPDLTFSSVMYQYGQFAIPGIYLYNLPSASMSALSSTWPMQCHDYKNSCSLPQ